MKLRDHLLEKLDQSQRRQIIFMDRDEFLDHSARILIDLNLDQSSELDGSENIPF
jgi:hypothetical protein